MIVGLLGGSVFTIPLMIVDAINQNSIGDSYYFIVWIIGLIISVVYLSYYRIEIDGDEVSIPNSLFDHRRTLIKIGELNDVRLDIGVGNKNKKSFYTLWLKMSKGKSQINIKTFSFKDLEGFMKYLHDNNQNITFDTYSQNMIEGKFKDVINKGISELMKYVLWLVLFAVCALIVVLIIVL
jgi:hypothetical protein